MSPVSIRKISATLSGITTFMHSERAEEVASPEQSLANVMSKINSPFSSITGPSTHIISSKQFTCFLLSKKLLDGNIRPGTFQCSIH